MTRLLGREARGFQILGAEPQAWRVDVAEGALPPVSLPDPAPRPALLLRSAFAPGDRTLGRRLLLGVLQELPPGTPWLGLAHEALDLLEDPAALSILEALEARGIPVRISEASAAFLRIETAFPRLPDAEWQALAARGDIILI